MKQYILTKAIAKNSFSDGDVPYTKIVFDPSVRDISVDENIFEGANRLTIYASTEMIQNIQVRGALNSKGTRWGDAILFKDDDFDDSEMFVLDGNRIIRLNPSKTYVVNGELVVDIKSIENVYDHIILTTGALESFLNTDIGLTVTKIYINSEKVIFEPMCITRHGSPDGFQIYVQTNKNKEELKEALLL